MTIWTVGKWKGETVQKCSSAKVEEIDKNAKIEEKNSRKLKVTTMEKIWTIEE